MPESTRPSSEQSNMEAVYAEAKRLVDSLDETAVTRAGCWAGIDLQPLCDLLGGPERFEMPDAPEWMQKDTRS